MEEENTKTVVQLFMVDETSELIYDGKKLDQWSKLVTDLGLTGQNDIVQPNKSPIPYVCMNRIQHTIIDTLCRSHVKVNEYNKQPIPLEILDAIALSMKEEYFHEIEIWYDDEQLDPVAIGLIVEYYAYMKVGSETSWNRFEPNGMNYFKSKDEMIAKAKELGVELCHISTNINERYLIGRWGDVKQSFDQLAIKAKERFILKEKNNIDAELKRQQRKLDDLNNEAFDKFGI